MKFIAFEVSEKTFQLFTTNFITYKKNILQSLEIYRPEKRLLDLKSKKQPFLQKTSSYFD